MEDDVAYSRKAILFLVADEHTETYVLLEDDQTKDTHWRYARFNKKWAAVDAMTRVMADEVVRWEPRSPPTVAAHFLGAQ